jgi:3-oxo-4,17-pregnadiene-20-carboxyl-CoA hydratase alpha subunit
VAEPTVTLKEFFERAREGRLTGITCGGCGEVAIPPKEFCATCGARNWRSIGLSGDGTLASYTIIRVGPTKHAADTPYAVGVVRLTEGASLFGRIVDIPFEKLAVGLPVRFRPIVVNGQHAVGFSS